MTGYAEIESVGKQCLKLNAQQTSLGQHASMPLDTVTEIAFQPFIHNDYGFSEKGTYLGSTNIEDIGQSCQLGKGHITHGGT